METIIENDDGDDNTDEAFIVYGVGIRSDTNHEELR